MADRAKHAAAIIVADWSCYAGLVRNAKRGDLPALEATQMAHLLTLTQINAGYH